MKTETPRMLLECRYYKEAQEYLRKLPPEHFMESTPQATQREITLESLDLVHARRPEVQVFNELLVQYPLLRRRRPGQVVPDNMVVLHPDPIKAEGSYDVPLQPARPFWMLEYVSKSNSRKDYDDNMRRYEHELKVPYYLLFAPDEQELTLYRHTGERYVTVAPDGNGRCAIHELDLAVGLLDGWVRFWYQGELLPLPADLWRDLAATRHQLEDTQTQLDEMTRRAETEKQARVDLQRELDSLRAETKNRNGNRSRVGEEGHQNPFLLGRQERRKRWPIQFLLSCLP
ncbi:MAG: Uma2 family endonuclease [Planctomycetes bacterium]|nr:Uma2 family endonuclease [Planctomycetota bacterium]